MRQVLNKDELMKRIKNLNCEIRSHYKQEKGKQVRRQRKKIRRVQENHQGKRTRKNTQEKQRERSREPWDRSLTHKTETRGVKHEKLKGQNPEGEAEAGGGQEKRERGGVLEDVGNGKVEANQINLNGGNICG